MKSVFTPPSQVLDGVEQPNLIEPVATRLLNIWLRTSASFKIGGKNGAHLAVLETHRGPTKPRSLVSWYVSQIPGVQSLTQRGSN